VWNAQNLFCGVENKIEMESRAIVSFNNNIAKLEVKTSYCQKRRYEINARLTIFYPLGTTRTLFCKREHLKRFTVKNPPNGLGKNKAVL
jgi:hypothetical protein